MRRHKHIGLYTVYPRRRYFTGPIESGLTDVLGVGADTAANIAPVVSGGIIGAGAGAGIGALTGGNIGEAALIGGGIGAAGGLAQDFGVLPSFPGQTTGANFNAGTPGLDTSGTGLMTPTGTTAAATPSGASAVSTAAPAGVPGGLDLTSQQQAEFLSSNPASTANVSAALGTPPTGAPPSAGASLWNDATSGNFGALPGDIGKAILANPGALLAGGGLLYNLTRNQNVPGQKQLSNEASQLGGQGQQLASYLQSGTLPPGAQTAIDLATKASIASIRSKYASMGVPPNSTMEIQDINNVRMNAAAQGFQIADSLLKTGIDETALSAEIYNNLVNINQRQAAATGAAISNFAAALNGVNPGLTLKLAA